MSLDRKRQLVGRAFLVTVAFSAVCYLIGIILLLTACGQ